MSRHTAPCCEVTTPIRRGQRGNGALARVVEEPLGGEPRAQLLVSGMEVAGAGGRDRVDVELVDALRLVGADAAVDDDLHPVRRPDDRACELLAEQGRADLRAGVLEREEAVPAGRERGLADLALDPDVGEGRIGVEEAADATVQVGDAQDARGRLGGLLVPEGPLVGHATATGPG